MESGSKTAAIEALKAWRAECIRNVEAIDQLLGTLVAREGAARAVAGEISVDDLPETMAESPRIALAARIILSQPEVAWTKRRLAAEMNRAGFTFKATNSAAAASKILRKLEQRHAVRLAKKGKGGNENVYRAIPGSQFLNGGAAVSGGEGES